MVQDFRRIITGVNQYGKSTIIVDAVASTVQGDDETPVIVTELWKTSETPDRTLVDGASAAGPMTVADPVDGPVTIAPLPGGSLFRMCEFPPMSKVTKSWGSTFDAIGHHEESAETDEMGLHSTETIDYILVLSGEINCVFEDGEVLVKAGDTLVQRGTAHAWENRTDEPCIFTSILVGAVPRLT